MRVLAVAASFAVAVSALAQTGWTQQPIVLGSAANTSVLRAGTAIPMRTSEELTTKGKALRVGQRFRIETTEPVTLNGQTVIPVGTPGMGEVTSVRNKGMWGKSGNIEAHVLYLRVGDRQFRLSGTMNDKGKTGTAGVVGAVALVPIAGFFMTGTSAAIPMGAPVNAFLDEDVPVQFAAGAPAALITVPAPTTPSGAIAPSAIGKTVAVTPKR
ncbi:hypothetical protein [Sphingomonas sp.]|uniref:hypothetical protein n=1 Tax=Sphingomonas sp. TaxID=28214 RepID=UPI003AFFF556